MSAGNIVTDIGLNSLSLYVRCVIWCISLPLVLVCVPDQTMKDVPGETSVLREMKNACRIVAGNPEGNIKHLGDVDMQIGDRCYS
jgi:hypothetical protein